MVVDIDVSRIRPNLKASVVVTCKGVLFHPRHADGAQFDLVIPGSISSCLGRVTNVRGWEFIFLILQPCRFREAGSYWSDDSTFINRRLDVQWANGKPSCAESLLTPEKIELVSLLDSLIVTRRACALPRPIPCCQPRSNFSKTQFWELER